MYQNTQNGRNQFNANSVDTASNERILLMCFDRLDLDFARALAAIEANDPATTHDNLTHAQDLISELAHMVDTSLWEHGNSLIAVYDYLLRILTVANTMKTAPPVLEAQKIITEIGDAFREAAKITARETMQASSNGFDTGTAGSSGFSMQA